MKTLDIVQHFKWLRASKNRLITLLETVRAENIALIHTYVSRCPTGS